MKKPSSWIGEEPSRSAFSKAATTRLAKATSSSVGGRLPAEHRTWVLHDTTTRTWWLRHLLRALIQLAIPLAAVLPIVTLLLAVVGVLRVQTATWAALGLGVVTLAVQGARYAALERLGPGATAVSIALNVSLGLVIVGLKALIAH